MKRFGKETMATTSIYRVTYHFETNGKRISDTSQDNVVATGPDYASLSSVLSSNSKTNGGKGTLVIESVGHVGAVNGVLS